MSASLERFAELVTREQFGLAQACLLIAQDEYPDIDPAAGIAQIDGMAAVVRSRLPADAFVEQKIVALNRYLFDELGFHGNVEAYYDPRNSYLNQVLERRTGIPITLSILYMELGRRLGMRVEGVSFPGHFLVKLTVGDGVLVLDPFGGGEPQSEQDLRVRLQQALPKAHAESAGIETYLVGATSKQIVARMLRNLKAIYIRDGKLEQALAVMQRLLLVVPESAEELRDRGQLYARLECFRPALADLKNYLRRRPDAPDAAEVGTQIVELIGACTRLN